MTAIGFGALARHRLPTRMLPLIALVGVAAVAPVSPGHAQSTGARLDALIAAAKSEGELVFYFDGTENIAKRVVDAFTTKYPIKAQFLRLPNAQIEQRFSAEAEAGNIATDVVFNSGSAAAFAQAGIKKGWIEPLAQAELPALQADAFPRKLNRGPTAVVQIAPWLITYNNERVKGADIPKDWSDLADSKWRGRILMPNPKVSDAYIQFWTVIRTKFGDKFFDQLRAQDLRHYESGVPATNALSAGEGSIAVPAVPAQIQAMLDKGAPLGSVTLDYTTGVEMQVMLTAHEKAKHPNAARLFVNYVLSEEGNKVLNDNPGGLTIYDTSRLPKDYQAPQPATQDQRDQIAKLLGF